MASRYEQAVAAHPPEQQLALMDALYGVIAELQRAGVIAIARMRVTCRHFRPDVHHGERPHHCALFELPLAQRNLRIDCPEHERAA